jgi:uncharacterized protein YegJ (DUF2314 family)
VKWVFIIIAVLAAIHFTLMALGRRALRRGVVDIDPNDPDMQTAIRRAKDGVQELLHRLAAPPPTQSSAAVKVAIEEQGVTEHAWLAEPRIEGDHFVGRLDNNLAQIRRWRAGDMVRVPQTALSDWLAIDGGRLVGGFSIRLLRDRMQPEERARFDRSAGFVIDESG